MSSLQQVFRGRVWKFGDSVDTSSMAPGGLAGPTMRQVMRDHCLRGIRPDFNADVKPGDIIVAGANFGYGSSRQSAVEALQECGPGRRGRRDRDRLPRPPGTRRRRAHAHRAARLPGQR
jgi:3-isopropylmalate dehydratase small subunit